MALESPEKRSRYALRRWINVGAIAVASYLVGKALVATGPQGTLDTIVEILLAGLFIASIITRRRRTKYKVIRKKLQEIEDLDCSALGSEFCREFCEELQQLKRDIEHSDLLPSFGKRAWTWTCYFAGLIGLIVAIFTGGWGLAMVGGVLSGVTVASELLQSDNSEHWEGRFDDFKNRLALFSEKCLDHKL